MVSADDRNNDVVRSSTFDVNTPVSIDEDMNTTSYDDDGLSSDVLYSVVCCMFVDDDDVTDEIDGFSMELASLNEPEDETVEIFSLWYTDKFWNIDEDRKDEPLLNSVEIGVILINCSDKTFVFIGKIFNDDFDEYPNKLVS